MNLLNDLTPEQQEQYNELLQSLTKNIDPRDYLPPSVREIAKMDMQTLKSEYDLVKAKESERSSAQRNWIVERYEYEVAKAAALAQQEEVEDDGAE
jgi:hypothetical protein